MIKFQAATSFLERKPLVLWAVATGVVLLAGEAALQGRWYGLGAVAVVSILTALLARVQQGPGERGLAFALALLAGLTTIGAGLTGHTAIHARALQTEAVRDATMERDRLLKATVASARHTASLALDRVGDHPPTVATSLTDLINGNQVEAAIAVIASDTVLAVAGPQRMQPVMRSTPAALVSTPFARMLVIRATRASRQAQVILLLDSLPGLPVAAPSLAATAGRWQRVHWVWDAQLHRTVEYNTVEDAIVGVIAGMRAEAPPVQTFVARDAGVARLLVAIGIGALALIVLLTAAAPRARAGAVIVPLWALMRSGVADSLLGTATLRLILAAVALLMLAVVLWRRPPRRSVAGVVSSLVLLAAAPLLVMLLAQLVVPHGTALTLVTGFGWQAAIALAAGGYLAVAVAPLRTPDDRAGRAWWGIVAAAATLLVGVTGVEAWQPLMHPTSLTWSGLAPWYLPLSAIPLLLMLPVTPPRARLLAMTMLAGVLAALTTWSVSLDRRMELAHADLDRLLAPADTAAERALDAFAVTARQAHATHLDRLYATWGASELAREGVPIWIALWSANGNQRESVALDSLKVDWKELAPMVARSTGEASRQFGLPQRVGHHDVLIVPLAADTIATIAIGPRTRLLAPTTFGLLVGWRAPASDPPYDVSLPTDPSLIADGVFRRDQRYVRANVIVTGDEAPRVVQATVEMSTPQPFLVRAALVVLLDVGLIWGVWLLLQRLLGLERALPAGVFRRSYRRTLATTLMAFFLVPALIFTLTSVLRLRSDSQQQHASDMASTLRDVAVSGGIDVAMRPVPSADTLADISDNVNAAIGVYRNRRLAAASDSLLAKLGIVPPVFDPTQRVAGEADTNVLRSPLKRSNLRLGLMPTSLPGTTLLVAVPGSESALAQEGVDQALRLVLVSLLGVIASLLVAGVIARRLGQPIDTLRRTAIAIGHGDVLPRADNVPAEFVPVFSAITQMERDLRLSEIELRADRARTAAILSTVATGVVGLDAAGMVTHANPRAMELLESEIDRGRLLSEQLPARWSGVGEAIDRLLNHAGESPQSRELQVDSQRVAFTVAPLDDGGVVLAITDITEASRAARILAWGEMARQVAHEIKNPLTPMRLGLQHLRRVQRDRPVDLPHLVDETAERLLVEIERLDRIARSFARYGAPPEQATPLEPVPLRLVADEVVSLFVLGAERMQIEVIGNADGPVMTRREELTQVLLNLLDNARQAGAGGVQLQLSGHVLRVVDDGAGIPADQLGRIFEPSFSTTTSGTGLGLAIVRRLVEGWDATIGVESQLGAGAAFTIQFRPGGVAG